MTTKYEIVPAQPEHIHALAADMRKADVDEIWAAVHRSPFDGLRMSVEVSRDTKTGLADGKVVCMFGVAAPSLLSMRASPWLLGSNDLPKHARRFLRVSRYVIEDMRSQYELLYNHVDARNTLSIRWLKWLGFTIKDPIPFGPDQILFHPFEMRRPHV